MRKENLYFIAILPDDKTCKEIEVFKSDFANNFESRKAISVVTHITLKTPFKMSSLDHDDLMNWFGGLHIESGAFQIELKNFGAFHNKYSPVVYVNPIMNLPLYTLQKELIRSFRIKYPAIKVLDLELRFKPHITVAYRDLSPEKFKEAWNIYKTKEYNTVFDVGSFHLLQHDGIRWKVIQLSFL
ncbi:MAG: 2'-5' RNA ligase family protein [Agriterribacter sp.]